MKKLFIIFFFLGFFAVLPSFFHSLTTYAGAGAQGGACINGWSGTCQDVNTYSCNGTWTAGSYPWPCPYGGNNIICCTPYPVPPPPTSVNGSCSPSGTTFTVNWTLPSGYSYAYPRIYDETSGATCYPSQMTGTSYSCGTTPGHNYSYWVHTTYSSGSPYSSEVPTAHTVVVPCAAACQSDPTPVGSIISTGVAISASSVLNNDTTNYGPANIVDGQLDLNHYWNSGKGPTGWVELNLGAPQTVTGLTLYVRQNPNGATTTQILTGSAPNPGTVQRTLNCSSSDNQKINIVFPAPLTNVQYIRINTTSSPSWVAWNEISVYGSSPGSQTTTPGILFSGDGSAAFGQGSASTTNWVVGGLTYPEVFNTKRVIVTGGGGVPDSVKSVASLTSYQVILDRVNTSQATITDLSTFPSCNSLANCTLPANLPNGVYKANGNLGLNTYAFPPNKNYVFLINGDLNVLGNIIVPNGSTAFFTSSHDIIIDKNVGTATNLFPLPAGQLQGIFSADHDFRINSFGVNGSNCATGNKDKMLNIEGAIVTNALGNGGEIRRDRDLCGDNPRYPVITIRARLDMILNLPEILMQRSTTLREDAP